MDFRRKLVESEGKVQKSNSNFEFSNSNDQSKFLLWKWEGYKMKATKF